MRQRRIALDALQLVCDDLTHVGLDPIVVLLNLLLHAVIARLVGKVGYEGNLLISFLLLPDLLG